MNRWKYALVGLLVGAFAFPLVWNSDPSVIGQTVTVDSTQSPLVVNAAADLADLTPTDGQSVIIKTGAEKGLWYYDKDSSTATSVSVLNGPGSVGRFLVINNDAGSVAAATAITAAEITDDSLLELQAFDGSSAKSLTLEELKKTGVQVVSVLQYGADPTGVAECSTEIQAAVTAATASGAIVYAPPGTYLIDTTVTIDGTVSFIGDGIGKTIFETTAAVAAFTVNATATTGSTRLVIGGFTVDCNSVGTYGIDIGNAAGTATKKTRFEQIRVLEAVTHGIRMRSGIGNTFESVVVEDCPGTATGFFIDSENGVTECTFIQCAFRQNYRGMYLLSGNRLMFLSCTIESNRQTGLYMQRTATNGFANSRFIGCWIEGNGYSPTAAAGPFTCTANAGTDRLDATGSAFAVGNRVVFSTDGTPPAGLADDAGYWVTFASGTEVKLAHTRGGTAIDLTDTGSGTHSIYQISTSVASVFSDMSSGTAETVPTTVIFDSCVIASETEAFDVMIDRGTNLIFNACSFTASGALRGFTGGKFGWSSQLTCFARLIDCNSVNERATPTLYTSFPAMESSGSITGSSSYGHLGFAYEFHYQNRLYSNLGVWGRSAAPYADIVPARHGELLLNSATNEPWISTGRSANTDWLKLDRAVKVVEANTAGSGAPNSLAYSESGNVLTNEGVTAANYHTLPTAVAGLSYTFVVQDADGLRITAASGDTIRLGPNVTATAGYIESTTIGDVVTATAINTTEWVGHAYGTWTNGTWTYALADTP